MNIILKDHAKKRMSERNITLADLTDAINVPDYTINKGKKKEAYKKIKDKVVKIVYSEENKYIKVITVIWK